MTGNARKVDPEKRFPVQDGKLIIAPARKKYKLSDLLKGYSKKHRHQETDWGSKQGEEEW